MRKLLIIIIIALSHPILAAPAATDENARYQQALAFINEGNLDRAIEVLEALTNDNPHNQQYFYDYLASLSWAERDSDVVRLSSIVDLTEAPPYVLEAIGKSARNRHNFGLALTAYTHAFARDPFGEQSILGLAYTLVESGNNEAALAFTDALAKDAPNNLAIYEARAYALKEIPDYFGLLNVFERMLKIDPNNKTALRGRTLAASWLGAATVAYDLSQRNPDLYTREEHFRFEADRVGLDIRHAALTSKHSKASATELRSLREKLIARYEQIVQSGLANNPIAEQTIGDLLVVSSELGQAQDVVELYRRMTASNMTVSPYQKMLVAQAHLNLEQASEAETLFRDAINKAPDLFDAYLGLFYALTDQNQFEDAEAHLVETKARFSTPPFNRFFDDSQRLQLEIAIIQNESFQDQLAQAQNRLTELLDRAPANADIRSELATHYLWRGWPRAAQDEFKLALMYDSQNLGARIGVAQAMMAIDDSEGAAELINDLASEYPYNDRVEKLDEQWQRYNAWQYALDSYYDRNSSSFNTLSDYGIDGIIYSPTFAHSYRIFGHSWLINASTPEGDFTVQRNGIGLNYRRKHWNVSGELNASTQSEIALGVTGRATLAPNDFWTISTDIETESQSVPLRAQRAGIHGRHIGIDVNYRFDEKTTVGGGSRVATYTDENLRLSASAFGQQRFVNLYNYKMDGRLEGYISSNRDIEALYFNPSADGSLAIGLLNEHLLYRHFDHSFRHRLAVFGGVYMQENYAATPFWSARYEQQWAPNNGFELHYGASLARPVYDGRPETSWRIFAGLSGRF